MVLSGPSVTPDMAREVAEILHPDALKVRGEDDEEWNERQKEVRQQRRTTAALLVAAPSHGDMDLLLHKLAELSKVKRDTETMCRLLIAYAREFIRPEPYRLRVLAEAMSMSISGVRASYGPDEVAEVAVRIKRSDRKRTVSVVPPGPLEPAGGPLLGSFEQIMARIHEHHEQGSS